MKQQYIDDLSDDDLVAEWEAAAEHAAAAREDVRLLHQAVQDRQLGQYAPPPPPDPDAPEPQGAVTTDEAGA
jgi:hypothetical protein